MNFCLNCGARLADAGATLQFSSRNQTLPSPSPQKSSSKFVWLAISAVGLFGLLMFGAVFLFALFGTNGNSANRGTSNGLTNTPKGIFDAPADSGNNNKKTSDTPANNSPVSSNDLSADQPPAKDKPRLEPKQPTAEATFQVKSNDSWQTSDIFVVPNESYLLVAEGKSKVEGMGNLTARGAKGDKNNDRRLVENFATGALLMRTRRADGSTSTVQAVESGETTGFWITEADEKGFLEFCLNDNAPQANQGKLTVRFAAILQPNEKKKK